MKNSSASLSIIVPAFNEEKCLASTLNAILAAENFLRQKNPRAGSELIVVDNGSIDETANVARSLGATVVTHSEHNIAKVRNIGAKTANGDTLIFIDADVIVPQELLFRICEMMSNSSCAGGTVDTDYHPALFLVRAYLQCWRIFGKLTGMAQGAAQFCRREIFLELGGYDENIYMGEDVEFYWNLRKFAKAKEMHVEFLRDIRVVPSCRRFDTLLLWKIFLWTNPLFIAMMRRRKTAWRSWYETPPR